MGTVKKTLLANGLMRFPITLLYCTMGLVLGTFVLMVPEYANQIPQDKPDLMIPIFIRDYLPHGVIGILMIAIFSAAMSSLSSAINSLSAATVEDYLNADKKLSDDAYMKYSKKAAFFWGLICIALAFFTGDIADTVIEAINKIGSVFYGPILATFIAAIAIKKIGGKAINLGILAGVGVNTFLWLFVPSVFWFWWNAIGALVTIGVALLASTTLPNTKEIVKDIKLRDNFMFDRQKTILLIAFFIAIVIFSLFVPQLFS